MTAPPAALAGVLPGTLEALPFGLWVYDADSRLVFANATAWGQIGVEPQFIPPGTPLPTVVRLLAFRGVYGPGDPEAQAEQHLALDRRRPLRRLLRQESGACYELYSAPLPEGGFISVLVEVTALVGAAEEATSRARRLETVLSRLQAGHAVYDADRRLVATNPAYEDLIGLPRGTVRPGLVYGELLRLLAQRGEFANADPEQVIASRLAHDRGQRSVIQRDRPNGQALRFESQPMPDGGFLIEVTDITAARRAEDEARRRAAVLDGVLASLPLGVMVIGPDQRIRMINDAYHRIMAGSPAAVGEHRDEVARRRALAGEYGPGAVDDLIRRNVTPQVTTPSLRRRTRPNGTAIEVRAAPMPDGGYVQVVADITALQSAEAEARARAAEMQAMLDNMRHGISLYDKDQRLVAANALAARLTGLGPDVLRPGRTLAEIIDQQARLGEFGDPATAARHVDDARRLVPIVPGVRTRIRPDGTVIEIILAPTPDGGHVRTFSDVTARARAEAEAKRRAEMLRVTLDSVRHSIIMYGPDRRLVTANRLTETWVGLKNLDQRIGVLFDDLVQEQHAAGMFGEGEAAARIAASVLALDRSRPVRYQRRLPTGREIEVTSDPTPDGGFVITHTDITELVAAQAEAAERAALLQAMQDNMRHGIALFDAERRLVVGNALAARLNGFDSIAPLLGRTEPELATEMAARGEIGAQRLQAILAADMSEPRQALRTRPDGSIIEFRATPVPPGTPGGGYVVTYNDVTALLRAETEAARRAGILQVTLDNVRHGISYYGPDRRLIAANALAGRLGNHPPGSLVPGRLLDDLVHVHMATAGLDALQLEIARQALTMDRSVPARYVRPGADGQVIEVANDPTPDGGFVITHTDVTPLARAEAAAQHRAAVLQTMLDNIRHGVILFAPDRRIIAANPTVLRILELPPDTVLPGMALDALVDLLVATGEHDAAAAAAVRARDRSLPTRRFRTRRNGMVLETVSDPTPDGGFMMTYTDVSEDRRIRAELEAARVAAEAANSAKSRFLATMSHELRTPLNAVIGFSEALLVDPSTDRIKDYAGAIQEGGRALLSLIDDILDVTRAETTGFSVLLAEVEPGAVAEASLRLTRPQAEAAGVTMRAELPPGLPRVRADARRLRQVLLNLLSNAIKFTPAGGRITLSAGRDAEGALLLQVTDTGIGIPAADIPRAFEPFTQLDASLARRFHGSGLGLYLSRALAEAQGGTLALDSVEGQGTTATLRFPADRLFGG